MTYRLEYFALLKEQRGLGSETVATEARTPAQLYSFLKAEHGFRLEQDSLKVAVNEEFADWETELRDGDLIVFIPPVAGG